MINKNPIVDALTDDPVESLGDRIGTFNEQSSSFMPTQSDQPLHPPSTDLGNKVGTYIEPSSMSHPAQQQQKPPVGEPQPGDLGLAMIKGASNAGANLVSGVADIANYVVNKG